MSTRVIGFADKELRRDRRRAVAIDALLDAQDVRILDIGLFSFGATGAFLRHDNTPWPEVEQRAELELSDYKTHKVEILVTINFVDVETGRFGGNFIELSGNAFDVIQDLMLHLELRVASK